MEDFVSRRSRLAFLDVKSTEAALPRIADIMGASLGWSDKQKKDNLASVMQYMQVCGCGCGCRCGCGCGCGCGLGVSRGEVGQGLWYGSG
jgi:hypothetical protein